MHILLHPYILFYSKTTDEKNLDFTFLSVQENTYKFVCECGS